MELISIDKEKCKQDGICAAECPSKIIVVKVNERYPRLVRGGEAACIRCGHCVAVCPHGALDHRQVPLSQSPSISSALGVTDAQAYQFMRSRRSIRVFKDKPVEKEKIQKVIEIARYAPTAVNNQQVRWMAVTDTALIRQMTQLTIDWMQEFLITATPEETAYFPRLVYAWDAGMDLILRRAPVVIVASAPGEQRNGMVDLTIALSHLELAALPLGLGTCWAGLMQRALLFHEPLAEIVALPRDHTHHYPMMLGYPQYKYHRLPERNPPEILWRE